jgi:hypothetical protein
MLGARRLRGESSERRRSRHAWKVKSAEFAAIAASLMGS